ncbi:MAG: hypothetical protein ACOC0D_03270 [Spirochaeta sp.]
MRIRSATVFVGITVCFIGIAVIGPIWIIGAERYQVIQDGEISYAEFAAAWDNYFHSVDEDVFSRYSDFMTWFDRFIRSNPSIHSIKVSEPGQPPVFRWSRTEQALHEVRRASFSFSQVSFLQQEGLLQVEMEQDTIHHSSILQGLQFIGYTTAGYTGFLLVFFLGGILPRPGRRGAVLSGNTSVTAESSNEQDQVDEYQETHTDADPVPEAEEEIIYSAPPSELEQLILRLQTELNLSAEQEKDVSLLLLHLFPVEGTPADSWLLERFLYRDLLFSLGEDLYAVILPDTDIQQGLREARRTVEQWPETAMAGVTSRTGRLLEAQRFIKEARGSLRQARATEENVVGFQPDPQQYRRFIARSLQSSG